MAMRMWTLVGVVIMLAAFLAGIGAFRDGGTQASAQEADPAELFQQFVDALNADDVDGMLAVFADDAVVSGATFACVFSPCVGLDAIQRFAEGEVVANVDITIISSETSGNSVTGQMEKTFDIAEEKGLDRIIISFTAEVTDGAISSLVLAFDLEDEQTAAHVAGPPGSAITVSVGPGRDAAQPGRVLLGRTTGGRTNVNLEIQSGPAGVLQPAHIHQGSCPDVGAVAFPLQDVLAGRSVTNVDISFDDLQTGDFAINVHQSLEEIDVYVACGDIPALAAEEPETTTEAPAPTAPSTGVGGFAAEGSGVPTWWYALVAAGVLLMLGGLVTLASARRGR